jgi:hypothetical protein
LPSTPRDSHFLGCSTVMVSETSFLASNFLLQ